MTVSAALKALLAIPVDILNYKPIKAGIKNGAGIVSFAFGFAAVYDLYKIAKGRKFTTEGHSPARNWRETAYTATVVMAKISLLLSGMVSRPGVFLISTLAGRIFIPRQLEHWFGSNTTFARNPLHPRHFTSLVAVALALPSLALSSYHAARWVARKILHLQKAELYREPAGRWLTDLKLRSIILFNSATSRPILHLGNRFCHQLLR